LALVSKDESEPEILSNAIEVKARGGYIIGISPDNNDIFDYWIKVPDVGNAAADFEYYSVCKFWPTNCCVAWE
jgi:glucosamine--fructose-6-phosphate aminotransferase (isomerizing)